MMPSLSQFSDPDSTTVEVPGSEFTVGQRQMAALGFVAVLVLGFVATLAYLAGRVTTGGPATVHAAPAASQQPGSTAAKARQVEQLIVVEPAQPAASPATSTASKAAAIPKPLPPAAAAAPAASTPAASALRLPPPAPPAAAVAAPATQIKPPVVVPSAGLGSLAGNTFLQVAAVDRGMAEVSAEYLVRKGVPARVGDASSPGIYRVLVGPLNSEADISRQKAALEVLGFKPFVKKY